MSDFKKLTAYEPCSVEYVSVSGTSYIEQLKAENAKLKKLVRLLLWGVDNDIPRYEELAWSQKVNALVRELGVKTDYE